MMPVAPDVPTRGSRRTTAVSGSRRRAWVWRAQGIEATCNDRTVFVEKEGFEISAGMGSRGKIVLRTDAMRTIVLRCRGPFPAEERPNRR
jgi:hypothetical protein